MKLSLVLHARQSPGNVDSVFQRALDTCYATCEAYEIALRLEIDGEDSER